MALRTPLTAQPHLYIGDSTGRPLDYGRVYFGEPNKDPEFYPIDIYLDPEMTIAAAQPVRTKGGFMDVGGNLAELHAAEAVYSLKVLDQYGRQVFYKPEMYRNNVSDFLVDEITRATAAENLITGNLTVETQRAIAAEKVIATAVVTEKDRAVAAEVALNAKHAALSSTINSLGGGKKAYTTYALMVADKNNIAANSSIDVTNDTDPAKNGTYSYDGAVFTESIYDPALLAKDYTDSKVKPAIINFTDKLTMQASSLPVGSFALVSGDDKNNGFYEKAISGWSKLQYNPQDKINTLGGIEADNIEDILRFEDSQGQAVYKVNSLGEHYFVGLENDLKTEMDVKTEHNPLSSNDIFNFKDADGITTFKQTVDGNLHSVNIGNITQALKDAQNNIASIAIDNNENAKASLETLGTYTAGKYYDRAHIDKSKTTNEIGFIMTPAEIDAMSIYNYTVGVLRIPSMTRIAKNKFLIGFESRVNWADVGQISSTTCIATVDEDTHAVSISHVNDIGSYFVDEAGKWRAFMNPALVQLDDNKTVFTFILRRHERLEHELYMRKSTDNGKTWGEAIDISYVYNSNNWRLFLCNSNGFVKKYGKHKGRIIVPAFHSDAVYSSQYYRVLYIYSDDNGDTWELGEGLPWTETMPTESNFVEDFNGDMFVSARIENYGVNKDTRLLAKYVEKAGEYVQLPKPTGLNTEAAQGGLVRGDGRFDDSTAKIVACVNTYGLRNQPDNVRRTGLTVGISYDAMMSWITYNVPELDLSHTGYMNVEFLDENHLFVVYEGDNTTIKYTIIPVANVLQQGVKL